MFVKWSTAKPPVVVRKEQKGVPFKFGVIGLPTTLPMDFGPVGFGVSGLPTAPPETPCLDSLTSDVLVKDLIALDAALAMSPTMQTALRPGVGGPGIPFSFDD